MINFLSYLINGISLGSVYAIIALGYTMVYGIAKMLNFAHGDIIMVGGFTTFTVVSTMGGSPLLGVLAAVVVCTVLGVTVERVAYRPLRGASPLAVLITAIGVSYLLQNVALLIFGSNARQFAAVKAGRRSPLHFRRHHCHHCCLYYHYDRPDALYQQDEDRSGYAGCIGRQRGGHSDGY